jgi:hypothetical protein
VSSTISLLDPCYHSSTSTPRPFMAVMSPQPPIGAQEKVSSAAPTPASAGAGSMASDEAMGMDLDTSG